MLMENYSPRSPFKWQHAVLIILVMAAMIAILSVQINRWLPGYALSYSDLIAQQFQTKISFKTAHYRFPNHIIFKNVKVLGNDRKDTLLQANRIVLGFSFPLFSSSIPLHSMMVDGMVINFPNLKDYWNQHGKEISTWARRLPPGNMHLLIPNGQLYLIDPTKGEAVPFNIDLHRTHDRLSAYGWWGDKYKFNYKLNGTIREADFDLDKLTVEDSQSSVNLWGRWQDNNLDWKGFILYGKSYILDIDGHLKIEKKNIVLKKLSFSVNRDVFGISGDCLKQNLFQCNADITSKNIKLHLHVQDSLYGLFFKGAADIHSIHLDFDHLIVQMVNGNFIKLKIKRINSVFPIQGKGYAVPLENILASFNFAQPYQKTIDFSATLFDGHAYCRTFLDTSSLPWQVKSQGSLIGININQLNNPFFSLGESHGLLSSHFNFQSSPHNELNGSLVIHNGDFENSDAQTWTAQRLQMPSLDHISQVNLSCYFKIDRQSRMLENLKLDSDNLGLNGFFYLDAEDMVSSQISVRFSKKLFKESPVGRHIIGLVHRAWSLPFEFRLSGDIHQMNFQWDNSPLKNKVRHHLFSYFERMIDRRIDYKVTIPNESVSPG